MIVTWGKDRENHLMRWFDLQSLSFQLSKYESQVEGNYFLSLNCHQKPWCLDRVTNSEPKREARRRFSSHLGTILILFSPIFEPKIDQVLFIWHNTLSKVKVFGMAQVWSRNPRRNSHHTYSNCDSCVLWICRTAPLISELSNYLQLLRVAEEWKISVFLK